MRTTNFLIIGSGVAGLTLAIKISEKFPDRSVTVITKSNEEESNTKYAQGGIAVVTNTYKDSYQKHIEDTLLCGGGLCDEEVVKMVVKDGPERLSELIAWGARFDKNTQGDLDLGREGGHSEHRVVHHKDQTGREIEKVILAQSKSKKNIFLLDYHFALDLIVHDNCCFGAHVLVEKTREIVPFFADFSILATGGIGQVYGHTTNPLVATGDGIAMGSRAGALIQDMEFVQFHPTALYESGITTTFLVSEAVRGFGGCLQTKSGERFMLKYDAQGDLAPRDIVSQSIDIELKKSGESCVFMDCTHLDIMTFKRHFPMIYERCKSAGIDVAKDRIPVAPSQHYVCGGISVNKNGESSIKNLFACGECSRTGLHGANRLASNSLLEALVYSDRIFNYLATVGSKQAVSPEIPGVSSRNIQAIDPDFLLQGRKELQTLMLRYAGIVRNDEELCCAQKQFVFLQKKLENIGQTHRISKEFYELKNMVKVGLLIIEHSLKRKNSVGTFVKLKPAEVYRA